MKIRNVKGSTKDFSQPLIGSARDDFVSFLAEHGLEPDPKEGLIEHGRGRAYSEANGHSRKLKGWYLLFLDQENPFGAAFDWREGDQPIARWRPNGHDSLTPIQRQKEREAIRVARDEYHKRLAAEQAEVAQTCREFWDSCKPITDHPYLTLKQVKGHGLRESCGPDFAGYLVVPYRDESKQIVTLSYISPDGKDKWWHKGAKRRSTYALIGAEHLRTTPDRINYVEGYATGASWYEHINDSEPVIVTGDTSGMAEVPKLFAGWFPDATHVFVADNDESGAGQKAAEKGANAARLAGAEAEILMPGEVGQDFNDVASEGLLEGELIPSATSTLPVEYQRSPSTGRILQVQENYEALLQKHEIDIRYNVIKKEMEITIPGKSFINDLREDAEFGHIENLCIKDALGEARLAKNLPLLAREHNPVKDWIESKPWDGKPRVGDLLKTIDSDDNDLKDLLMRKWLAGCAAAACGAEGANQEGVLILVGRQALGKTQWFKKLAPDPSWLLEGATLNPSDKDSVKVCVSHWIVELGELGSTFRKADVDQLKAFLTKSKDEIRLPYGRAWSKYQRRTAFYGSVNEREFLVDPTGNRRFWVVRVNRINFDHGIDMQQVWAEVWDEVLAGKQTWFLDGDERERLQVSNEVSRTQSAVEDVLLQQVNFSGTNTKPVQMVQLLADLGVTNPRMGDYKEASRILHEKVLRPRKSHGKKLWDVDYTPLPAPSPHKSWDAF